MHFIQVSTEDVLQQYPHVFFTLTEFRHMAHFWMSYGRCTIPGSPMGRSEGLPRRWTG